ncbi:MAG: hypothetical protein H0V89_06695 [Deltaproteobacteria bacterium]|nr:hypothetical protein [Deltaproteobacteria bacterium]
MSALALLLACQPVGVPPGGECLVEAPPPGVVVVREVGCSDEIPAGGAGRNGADFLLANSVFRAVIRSPPTALTILGTGGGTLIDAAPWTTGNDDLHEAIPRVGAGWMDLETVELTEDGIRLGGTVDGVAREVSWRIEPDDPWLYLDGADGLDVHPVPAAVWSSTTARLQSLGVVYAPGGALTEDLGGVLRFDATDRLLVADTVSAWDALGPTVHIRGVAPDASDLRLYADEILIGKIALDPEAEGVFDLAIPAETTTVRAYGAGLPSAPTAPGEDLVFSLGTPAPLQVGLVWDGVTPRDVEVDLVTAAGSASVVVPADGAVIDGAPGQVEVIVGGELSLARTAVTVEVPPEGAAISLTIRPDWDPGLRVAALLGQPTDRDRSLRTSVTRTFANAKADGFAFTVLASTDAITDGDVSDDPGRLGYRNGVRSTHPDGWSIVSWPWKSSDKFGGWGAPNLAPLDPVEALQVSTGASTRRFTLVDPAWLAVAGAPSDHRFLPDFLALADPGTSEPAAVWTDWFAWLDQGAALVPTGPITWVTVDDPALVAATEVEDGLVHGEVVAGTGPVIDFTWHDTPPGSVVIEEPARPGIPGVLRLAGSGTIDQLALVGSGGATVASWTVDGDGETLALVPGDPGAWVIAVGWTTGGGDWAVTGPVWIQPPG